MNTLNLKKMDAHEYITHKPYWEPEDYDFRTGCTYNDKDFVKECLECFMLK